MKVLSKLTGILAFCGLLFVMSGWTSDDNMDNNRAFINKDFGCGMFDGDGGFVFTLDKNLSVVTSSGHTTLICKGEGPNSQGKAVITKGFQCGTFLGVTTDSKNTVSASGNITLRCRI